MKTLCKPGSQTKFIRWFEDLTIADVSVAGGKNASLGELVRALRPRGINVSDGFALTANAYRTFLKHNQLEKPIAKHLSHLTQHSSSLSNVSKKIRMLFDNASFPDDLSQQLLEAYNKLSKLYNVSETDVAVRSSATAEDLPDASFAGQQETFLNVSGSQSLLAATLKCFSSLFTERAISYREQKGFEHSAVALSVGVQKMIRSDKGCSGVMFTIDTETGFPKTIVINAAYGLGETVVQGSVTPDEFRVFKTQLHESKFTPIIQRKLGSKKIQMVYGDTNEVSIIKTPEIKQACFCITDDQILQLARWAVKIEEHYGLPMDIEWALDGESNKLFILQARPETVQSRCDTMTIHTARLTEQAPSPLVEGLAIGSGITSGTSVVLNDLSQAEDFQKGQILVANQTDPDWVPLMRKAAAIITNHGGRTSHAAIVSRELGVPAVIGTGNATQKIPSGTEITINCTGGQEGEVYPGILQYEEREISIDNIPETKTKVMLNIASPEAAMHWWRLPCDGIGLTRMEFIINNSIKIHPMALACFDQLKDSNTKKEILKIIGQTSPTDFFIDTLASGIATIAATLYPEPVVVRMSDFKTNEYAHLLGGESFEPEEENPMLGFRGASRYYSDAYRPGFALECAAIKKARNEMGLANIIVMIPFCRTIEEADLVLKVMADNGLIQGEDELKVYVMAEIPSNIILADQFAERFDGFSIGSNDLTQLVLGCDRDSDQLSHLFDERNQAVKCMITQLINAAHKQNTPVGICGQAPSDYPEFVEFLVEAGINSISVTPDSLLRTRQNVKKAEEK